MLSRSMRFMLIPVSACLILTAASTFAGGSPPTSDVDCSSPRSIRKDRDRDKDKEPELPRAERMIEGLHKRMMGLRYLRHDAVKNGDVETVRKVDDAIEAMVKSLDGSFPDLMQVVEQHEAADRKADDQKSMSGRDKRPDGMTRRIGDGKPTTEDMRKRMAEKNREKIDRRTSDRPGSDAHSDGSDN